jgi:hypothetical protein
MVEVSCQIVEHGNRIKQDGSTTGFNASPIVGKGGCHERGEQQTTSVSIN